MNRLVLACVAVAALVGAIVLGWFEVRQGRDFRRLLAAGDAALAHDQTSAAIEAFSGAIALRRDSMLGWVKRGDTYHRTGDFGSALRDLEQANRLDPDAPRPMELLGDVNDALGHHARAIEYYSRFLTIDDRAPRILYKLALAHYRGGNASTASDIVKKALALDRQFAEAYYLLGICERDTRRPDDAAASFRRALVVNPTFAPAREELAALESGRGRRREGLEQLEALAALQPSAERLVDVADAYARAGRVDSAAATLARGAERYPSSPVVYESLARFWLDAAEAQRDQVATRNASMAIDGVAERDPQSSELPLLRGRIQLLTGDAPGAERSLQAATTTLPVNPAAFRYLADAAARLGHRDVARLAQARYAALAP